MGIEKSICLDPERVGVARPCIQIEHQERRRHHRHSEEDQDHDGQYEESSLVSHGLVGDVYGDRSGLRRSVLGCSHIEIICSGPDSQRFEFEGGRSASSDSGYVSVCINASGKIDTAVIDLVLRRHRNGWPAHPRPGQSGHGQSSVPERPCIGDVLRIRRNHIHSHRGDTPGQSLHRGGACRKLRDYEIGDVRP